MPRILALDDCLAELATMGRAEIKKFIGFMKAHPNTVNAWILGISKPPSGENFLKAELFFSLRGLQLAELEHVSEMARSMGRYWCTEVVTADDLRTALGYKDTDIQWLYDIANGRRVPYQQAGVNLAKLLDSKKAEYDVRYKELVRKYGVTQNQHSAVVTTTPRSDSLAPAIASLDNTQVVEILAAILSAAAPIALAIDARDDDDEREKVRQTVGPEKFFLLSTALNKMTSWRTRQDLDARTHSGLMKGHS